MYVQNLNNKPIIQLPEWDAFTKPFGFTPKETDQFITNYVNFLSSRMQRSLQRMVEAYKEMKRREQSNDR